VSDESDAVVHGCSYGQSACFWPSVTKVRATQDRGHLEKNAMGDLKARWHFCKTSTHLRDKHEFKEKKKNSDIIKK
jgi:hypothetical protein